MQSDERGRRFSGDANPEPSIQLYPVPITAREPRDAPAQCVCGRQRAASDPSPLGARRGSLSYHLLTQHRTQRGTPRCRLRLFRAMLDL
jgi:hypothetical protein